MHLYHPPSPTPLQHVHKFEALAGGGEVLESHLVHGLPEFLNAEVALRTVPDVSEAVRWLKSTFMYLRVWVFVLLVFEVLNRARVGCTTTPYHGTDLSQPQSLWYACWKPRDPRVPAQAAICADDSSKPSTAWVGAWRPGGLATM